MLEQIADNKGPASWRCAIPCSLLAQAQNAAACASGEGVRRRESQSLERRKATGLPCARVAADNVSPSQEVAHGET
jgi:hypothetical protein